MLWLKVPDEPQRFRRHFYSFFLFHMVRSYLKTNIRLQKVHQRNQKPSYKHLSKDQKALVKAQETRERCELEMHKAEVVYNISNWRDQDWGQQLLEDYWRAGERLSRFSEKLGIETEAEINDLLNSTRGRFYGGSF